jgi:EAL domain-containing protein (putative c-di-GMP-specific phosphodiesterase class I)
MTHQPSDHFAAFAFSSADLLFEVDKNGFIVFAEGATSVLLHRERSGLTGVRLADIVTKKQHKRFYNMLDSLERLTRIDAISLNLLDENGSPVLFRVSGLYVNHRGGRYYLSLRAESELQSPQDLDTRDTQTGVMDQDTFAIKASERLAQAAEKGEAANLTILDFPGLKDMLDTLGESNAKLLMQVIGDYVKDHSVDGESYSIITPGKMDKQELVAGLKQEAKTKVSESIDLDIVAHTVETESDEYPLSPQDTANAVRYTINKFASERGEGFTIHSLNESYEEMLDETLKHVVAFRRTLNEDDYEMAFQPIVSLRDGLVHHHECLVRLNSKEQFSNPFEFINFGEQSGLINEFDLAITNKAIEIIREYKTKDIPVVLAINLSGRSLGSNLFLDTLLNVLRDNEDIRPQLMFEITESFKIDSMSMANDFIKTLRDEGHEVCLDDFGSGESSFDYLRHLHVDYVKIDGSYVRDSMKTVRGRKLLRAMAGLCRQLDMKMIGEMVETKKEAEFLHECGVLYGQGYLIGKPDTDVNVLSSHGKTLSTFSGLFNIRRFQSDNESQSPLEKAEKEWDKLASM